MQLSWNIAIVAYAMVYAVYTFRVSRNPGAALTVLLAAFSMYTSWLFMDSPLYSVLSLYILLALAFSFRFGVLYDKLLLLAFGAMNVFQCLFVIGGIRPEFAEQGVELGKLVLAGGADASVQGLVYALGRNFALFLAAALVTRLVHLARQGR
ncbi:hypothetical protein LJC48_07385, partial [Desulfovibrio sp. OttesenSCG-928-C06]|nr:hypothetical protein [Desulfovibrio sp. OttesenSCG-928-C06]